MLESVKSALLIVDMINTLEFPEAKELLKSARPAAQKIAALKRRFKQAKLPVIYVNDNYGAWSADWKAIYKKCAAPESLGHELARELKPEEGDLFVLKPRHSGFHETPLEILLRDLKVKRVVVTGIAGNICVLFTAHDAHMRGFEVVVPKDCMASNTKVLNTHALSQLKEGLKINTPLSTHLP